MNNVNNESITTLLEQVKMGDPVAQNSLINKIYPTICQIASRHLHKIGHNITLDTQDLANEAFLKISGNGMDQCQSTRHYYNAVCMVIQNILADHGRKKMREKHGGDVVKVSLSDGLVDIPAPESFPNWLVFEQAFEELTNVQLVAAEIVQLRYIMGLNINECADLLEIGTATVTRHWQFARAWLRRYLEQGAA